MFSIEPSTTAVVAGYSLFVLSTLDARLPPRTVVVLEESHVLRARSARAVVEGVPCVRSLLEAPTQHLDDLVSYEVGDVHDVACVIPGIEYSAAAAAALSERWGLEGAGAKAAQLLRNKLELRAAAARSSEPIAQPRYRPCATLEEAERAAADVGYPVILKPANREASLGVQVVASASELPAAWHRTVTADEPELVAPGALPPQFIVEELLVGPEYSVELLVFRGEVAFGNVTAKSTAPGAFPVELQHVVPAPLPAADRDALVEATRRLSRSVGFRTGVLHAEWIWQDAQPYLVECAGRLPGDAIPRLIELAWEFPFVDTYLDMLAGRRPSAPATPAQVATIGFLRVAPGIVDQVQGAEEATGMPCVVEVEIEVGPGDTVAELASSWARAGHVIAVGADHAEAAARLDAALAAITVSTKPT